MPVLPLEKRDSCWGYYCTGSSTWVWGRWILFVLFLVSLLVLILSAIRINKRRNQQGREPIRGTAWITPPSYRQSQYQNNGTQQPYVPPYTEQTNDNDAGYYDTQGVFHPNLKAQEVAAMNNTPQYTGQPQHLNTLVPDQTGLSSVPPAHTGQPQFTGDNHEQNFQRDFSQYYNRGTYDQINGGNGSESANDHPHVELRNFTRPEGPPPAHLKGSN